MRIQKIVSSFIFLTAALPTLGFADEAQLAGMIQQLQQQMVQIQSTMELQRKTLQIQNEKIAQLEERVPSLTAGGGTGEETGGQMPAEGAAFETELDQSLGGAQKWLKGLKFGGDFRLRYEAFDFTSGDPSETDARNRFRYRLRYGFEKNFNPDMKVGFAMASGENTNGVQTDPTGTNASFDNNFNFKDLYIEKAFGTYTPSWAVRGPVEKFEVTAGKFANPFERGASEIVWDRDVKPEGIYETLDLGSWGGEDLHFSPYFTAGQYVLDEDASTGGDAEMFGYQIGLNTVIQTPLAEKPLDWLTAVSFYSYNDYARANNFLIGTTSLARGNATCGDELCARDFEIWQYYNEVALTAKGIPVRPYFDLAHNAANAALGDEGVAWALGTKVGKIAKKGDWEISYSYRRIEPEAVVGAFADSDFGNGHAGKRGNAFKLGYALTDSLTANAAAFFVNNLATGGTSLRDEEQRRFQIDLGWKF